MRLWKQAILCAMYLVRAVIETKHWQDFGLGVQPSSG